MHRSYRTALTDWLACASAGRRTPAARAARAAGDGLHDRVVYAATAGHVLDFDDTYLPGLAHLSAPTAPVAIVFGAHLGASTGQALDAYAAGFEAMAAVAAASHPGLYQGGWHPTAVCGTVGAAVTAAHLLQPDGRMATDASNLAVLGAGGFRAAFGSAGKSLQVGLAAAAGVHAATLVAAGTEVPATTRTGRWGFEDVFGARWAEPDTAAPAIAANWLKRYPCCLQTHGAIEAAVTARAEGASTDGRGAVRVHPISCDAAPLGPDVTTALEARFSISYCTALGIVRGHPALDDLGAVDPAVRGLAERIEVITDPDLRESEAQLRWVQPDGHVIRAAVGAAVGSPDRPMDEEQVRTKLRMLGAGHLPSLFDDLAGPVSSLAEVIDA